MDVLSQVSVPWRDGKSAGANEEKQWIDRAKSGDREAFGELVRMHRAKALGIAGKLAKDVHLAEDIVQEALLRAFLHLGTLTDNAKFSAWLQRIVRNQAYMKIRRGGPYVSELPFESWTGGAGAASVGSSRQESVDWRNIDSILFHLAKSAQSSAEGITSPEQCLIRKETIEGIRLLVRCLNKRERDIFEAHFFEELPPSDIAALLGTTTAGVYNSLSRSRAKLRKERIRISIGLYVEKRAALGLPRKKILSTPP
ncbi:RNA polymerase sigma factor [Paenibacillus sp. GCM10027627]|uniref:RNA polymerase sigma factor n=1 Tax=unclassified Paenibacillus TaxID=185978 RepID=UPI00362D7D36